MGVRGAGSCSPPPPPQPAAICRKRGFEACTHRYHYFVISILISKCGKRNELVHVRVTLYWLIGNPCSKETEFNDKTRRLLLISVHLGYRSNIWLQAWIISCMRVLFTSTHNCSHITCSTCYSNSYCNSDRINN
jgi:hypothetical protein